MVDLLLLIISIVLIVCSVGLLVIGYIETKMDNRRYSLDEQRRIIADAEALRQEAYETYHQLLQESIRWSREDYQQKRRNVADKPAKDE